MARRKMSTSTKPVRSTVPNVIKPNSLPRSPVVGNKRIRPRGLPLASNNS